MGVIGFRHPPAGRVGREAAGEGEPPERSVWVAKTRQRLNLAAKQRSIWSLAGYVSEFEIDFSLQYWLESGLTELTDFISSCHYYVHRFETDWVTNRKAMIEMFLFFLFLCLIDYTQCRKVILDFGSSGFGQARHDHSTDEFDARPRARWVSCQAIGLRPVIAGLCSRDTLVSGSGHRADRFSEPLAERDSIFAP